MLLAGIETQVEDAVRDIRRLVYGLRPPAIDEYGLLRAIQQYATQLSVVAAATGTGRRRRLPRRAARGGRGGGLPDRDGGDDERVAASGARPVRSDFCGRYAHA